MNAAPLLFMFLIFDFGGSHTESDTIHRLEVQETLFHTRLESLCAQDDVGLVTRCGSSSLVPL